MSQTDYDIFISYRTARRPWVEILAHNLQAQGYKVFLDAWEITGGQNFTRVIFDALKNARYAILIATPDAAESGWVQDEYEYMVNLSKNRDDFYWIPVVLGEFPDFPFLSNVQAVDFGDSQPETYRVAFQKLLCGLRQQAPGAKPYFSGKLQFPETEQPQAGRKLAEREQTFIDSVFSYLDAGTQLMVLAQADTSTQHYAHALMRSSRRLRRVIRMKPCCICSRPPVPALTAPPISGAWPSSAVLTRPSAKAGNGRMRCVSNWKRGVNSCCW